MTKTTTAEQNSALSTANKKHQHGGLGVIPSINQTEKPVIPTFRQPTRVMGGLVTAIGLVGALGYFVELPWLQALYEFSAYEPSLITVGLLFLGVAMLLSTGSDPQTSPESRWLKLVRNVSLLIAGGIGFYFVLLDLASEHFNLLNLFARNTPDTTSSPSFISALCLLISAGVIYAFKRYWRSQITVVYLVGLPALFVWNLSLIGIFSYYYDLPVLYNFNMTLPDTVVYFLVSIFTLISTIPYQGILHPIISPIPKVRWIVYAAIAIGLFILAYGINSIAQLIEPRRLLEELAYRRSYVSFILATITVAILTKALALRAAQYFNQAACQGLQQSQGIERERVIQQILQAVRSSLNLVEIFEKIVNELGINLEADRCFITRYQFDSKQLSPPSREYLSSDDLPSMIGTQQQLSKAPEWLEQLVAQAKPIDFDPDTPGFYPEITAYLKTIQVQSGVGCAITYQGEVLAILFLHQCHQKRSWTTEEKKLIQTAAGQLGVAIHQANRYEVSRVQANQQKGVAELSQRGLLGVDLIILIDQAVELVAEILKMEYCNVLEYRPEQKNFKLASGHGLQHGLTRHATVDANLESQAGYTLASHKAVVVNNFESETRFTGMPFLQDHRVMSGMTVTIYGYAHEKPYGLLAVHAKEPRWFSQDDIHFVEAIANVLGMAIKRKQTESNLQSSRETAKSAQVEAESSREAAKSAQVEAESSREAAKVAQIKAELSKEEAEAAQAIAEAAQGIAEAAQADTKTINEALAASENMLKKYAADLEQSNLDLHQFATIASHDLQAPLRKVRIFIDQLKQNEAEILKAESQDLINRIQKSVESMQDLINDLLALSQIAKGKKAFAPVELNNVLLEVKADLSGLIQDKKAQVKISPMCMVQGDADQLRQLFHNLIENALKFQPEGNLPRISVTANLSEEDCEIQVKDNGIGFDQKQANRVFNIFERLHSKSVYPGTGVGLAICKRIVERHHGSIEATSEPGKGTTFLVKLPLSIA
ncbi:GAF domain-containing protein [Vampirovibrio sp.]|uniref:GAF domain-containing sensor histidine kinase n=1 Tax=Vampirovibrio sp. TaxID=2717857 RepID=UPI0035933DF2